VTVTIKTLSPSSAPYAETWEIQRMLRHAKYYGPVERRSRNILLVYLCYRYGLRTREIQSLTWSHINFEAGLMELPRPLGIHTLELDTVESLRCLQKHPWVGNHDYVFAPVRKKRKLLMEVIPINQLKDQDFKTFVQNSAIPKPKKVLHLPMVSGSIRSLLAELSQPAVGRRLSPSMMRRGLVAHLQQELVHPMQISDYIGTKVESWYTGKTDIELALEKISYNTLTNATKNETS